MKKMAVGILVVLATLSVVTSPAMAANSSWEAVTLGAFLSSLASPGTPAPVDAAKRPALGSKAFCNVNCGPGGTFSCSEGTTSCSSMDQNCSAGQQGFLTCDGVTTWCPNACPCTLNCAAERNNCDIDCGTCPFIFSCSTSTCTFSCQCRPNGHCLL